MEHGGKMEHRMFWKKYAWCGSIFRSIWFLLSASSVSHVKIKLTIDHVLSISRKRYFTFLIYQLTHWGRVTHICVGKLTTIGSDNGLSPGRRQAIIWTNDGILLIRTLGTNFSEILSEIHSFSFMKTHLKMSSAKWRLSHLGLNELTSVLTSIVLTN